MTALDELEEIKELVNENKRFKYKNIVNFNCDCIKNELEYADNCHKIEEQLSCPLDVLGKVMLQKHFYDIYGNKIETNIGYIDQEGTMEIVMSIEEYKWDRWAGRDVVVYLKDYKKTWWLKEDKSE